jgi:hypothetical protein
MIDFSKLKSVTNTGEVREYRASLVDGKWYGKKANNWFLIKIPANICNTIHYIFSSKANDYWEEGTLKKHEKLNRKDYKDSGFWTPFRQGLRFHGTLINEHIIVDWKHHQVILEKEYGNSHIKFIESK